MSIKHVSLTKVISDITELHPDLVIGVTGDIHLHHPRVPSQRIIRHLNEIYNDDYLSLLDVLVLNGDVFDRRVSAESEDFTAILYWIARLLRMCKKHAVRLIVVEGTRSHDHRQPELFCFINDLSAIGCDLHYYDKLKVGNVFGDYTALYVPDEINHDASITAQQSLELIQQQGLERVDFAFMHGMFRYQLPIESVAAHNEEFLSSIVTKRIVINHVHIPSSKGIIRAPGSTVRLKHGEEEVKGHYCLALKDGVVSDWFIETAGNIVFKTIDVSGLAIDAVYEILDDLDELEDGSFIRLSLTRQCPSYASLRVIKARYPHFKLTEHFLDSKITSLGDGHSLIDANVRSLVLTEDVVLAILHERVSSKFINDPAALAVMSTLLSGEE